MRIEKADFEDIESIVGMSKSAFRTDLNVGGKEGDYPPGYDSYAWHRQMADEGHLYKAISDHTLVGAAVLFPNENTERLYIGRIFLDGIYHKKGYGIQLMRSIEEYFPHVRQIELDTPRWNVRTNSFYKKVGYTIAKEEGGLIYYRKDLDRESRPAENETRRKG